MVSLGFQLTHPGVFQNPARAEGQGLGVGHGDEGTVEDLRVGAEAGVLVGLGESVLNVRYNALLK